MECDCENENGRYIFTRKVIKRCLILNQFLQVPQQTVICYNGNQCLDLLRILLWSNLTNCSGINVLLNYRNILFIFKWNEWMLNTSIYIQSMSIYRYWAKWHCPWASSSGLSWKLNFCLNYTSDRSNKCVGYSKFL